MVKGNTKRFCKKGHDFKIVERDAEGRCKPCREAYIKSDKYQTSHKAVTKKWQEDNRAYKSEQVREWQYRKKFGITIQEYNVMLAEQNNSCAVCERSQTDFKRKFAVDHDHKTGKVRRLLCDNCNHALGMVNDNPIILQKLILYLEKYNRIPA
jgi:hypothetical protein